MSPPGADRVGGRAARVAAGALAVLGLTATASQVLILRELLVAFQGNELLLGIFLGNWLFLGAAGAVLARVAADRLTRPDPAYALLQAALGLAPVASLLLVRSFKAALGISTGEVLAISWAFAVSLAALLPAAAADGAAFPLGCRVLAERSGTDRAVGTAFAWSAAGSVLGGLLFLVPALYAMSPLRLAVLLAIPSVLSAWAILAAAGSSATVRRVVLGVLAAVLLVTAGPLPERLEAWSAQVQWHDQALLWSARSPYTGVAVVRASEQITVFANGTPAAAFPHPGPEAEVLAHLALLLHEAPRRVLVLGGGAGGLLREILRHEPDLVAYAEQDPLLFEAFRRFPDPLTELELGHPAVRTHAVEGRLFLRESGGPWDVVLLNLPPPSTLMLNRYYTLEFFELVGRRLAEGGILVFGLPGSETFLAPELTALNGTVHAALRGAFRHVRILPGDPTLFAASAGAGLADSWDPRVLAARMAARGVRGDLVSADYFRYRLDAERFALLAESIRAETAVNRDTLPRGTFAAMRHDSRVASPAAAATLAALDGIPARTYAGAILAGVLFLLALQTARGRRYYLGVAAASTGGAGMVLCVAMIFAFQVQYGDVYQYIGLLTALFMLGAAAGASWGSGRGGGPLPAVEAALVLTLLAASACAALGPREEVWLPAIVLLMGLMGAATGAQFPILVSRLRGEGGRIGASVAGISALDLAGAVGGAVLAGIVLIPTLGLTATLLLTAAVKLGSLALILAWRSAR